MAKAKNQYHKAVEALRHEEATRKSIPTVEYQAVLEKEAKDRSRSQWRPASCWT